MTLQENDEHELGDGIAFSVRGKGDKIRDVALNADQADILDSW